MPSPSENIILIGMAGAGKSTIGSLLAASLDYAYIDTDHLIEATHGRALQEIVDALGQDSFKELEEQTAMGLNGRHQVIATGGSVVYSDKAMGHLKTLGTLVWLDIDVATLESRVVRQDARGLVGKKNQTFSDLYHERRPLYQQYADICINCSHCTPREMVQAIIKALSGRLSTYPRR